MTGEVYLVWVTGPRMWRGAGMSSLTRRLSQARRCSRADALLECQREMFEFRDLLGEVTATRFASVPVALDDVLAMLRDPDGAEYVPGNAPWE